MIPLRDVIPSRTTPFVNVTLIVVNAIAWFYEVSLPHEALTDLLMVGGVVPANVNPPALFTSLFLHGGWAHVIGNMWFLWIFGDNVEDRLGHGRYLVFYLLCGVGATIGYVAMDSASTLPLVGASGAIAGVMGAYFVLYPKSRVLTLIPLIIIWDIVEIPAVFLLGVWFALQLVSAGSIAASSPEGGVAFAAHVTGFALGVAGVFLFKKRGRQAPW